jgi:pimeloyl-ACP methyl ester carboxylesterase
VGAQRVPTRLGPVEVAQSSGSAERHVLLFPGGHCTAVTPVGQDVYEELGFRVTTVSRPGYGATSVGPLTAAQFVPAVLDVAAWLGVDRFDAVVGVSYGGLQALRTAVDTELAQRLVLHSCAPSTLQFPDTRRDRLMAPLAFHPRVEAATWAATRAMVRTDRGLRLMMGELSVEPTDQWFLRWSRLERDQARQTLLSMRSGGGFVLDVGQGRASGAPEREGVQRAVRVPTLVTGSRTDGGASFAHALDLHSTIPGSELVETGAPSHFAWIGPPRSVLLESLRSFLAA